MGVVPTTNPHPLCKTCSFCDKEKWIGSHWGAGEYIYKCVIEKEYFNRVLPPTNIPDCEFYAESLENVCKRSKKEKDMSLKDVISMADKCRNEIVLCLIGAPGIGKTQAVYEFAEEHGRKVVEIIASQILPNEVSGITMPVQESKSMEIFDHARLSSLQDGDILFFDELLQAAPSTLAACLTLIQERRLMSGKRLPDVLIVAAANPVTSYNTIPLSVRQRFMFYECEWNRKAWVKWIKDTYGYEVSTELLHQIKLEGPSMNVFTPRSCTKCIEWINATNGSDDTYEAIMRMFGVSTATYLREMIQSKNPMDQVIDTVVNYYMDSPEWKASKVAEQGNGTNLIISKPIDSSELEANDYVIPLETLKDADAEELMNILTSFPDWNNIKELLEKTEVKDETTPMWADQTA